MTDEQYEFMKKYWHVWGELRVSVLLNSFPWKRPSIATRSCTWIYLAVAAIDKEMVAMNLLPNIEVLGIHFHTHYWEASPK